MVNFLTSSILSIKLFIDYLYFGFFIYPQTVSNITINSIGEIIKVFVVMTVTTNTVKK